MTDESREGADNAYGTSEFLCSLCSRALTESCYNCGVEVYWRSFEPSEEMLDSPPDLPNMRRWHSAGYGEKINILGFYMRVLLGDRRPVDTYRFTR